MCTNTTERRPENFYALNTGFPKVAHVNYGVCQPYAITGGITKHTAWKDEGVNIVFSRGVSLKGANVSAQSGWNEQTRTQYEVTKSSYVCASQAVGPATSKNLSAKPM